MQFTPGYLSKEIRRRVDDFNPDLVWVTDGWTLKPYLLDSLAHHKPWHSFFAYEMLCPANNERFKRGQRCYKTVLTDPLDCCVEVTGQLGLHVAGGGLQCVSHETLASRAFLPTYGRLVREALAKCARHIVYGPQYLGLLEGISDAISIVPGGVDTSHFSPKPTRGEGILMVGRVDDPAKGLRVLLAAIEQLRSRGIEAGVRVTGSGDYGPDVQALGWVPPAKLPDLYRSAAVVVIPSLWEEPFGLVAVEAMACGVPVVASRHGGPSTIVEDGVTGFLVTPGDPAELAERLEQLLSDRNLRQRFGEAGRERAVALFDWDKIVDTHYLPMIEGHMEHRGLG
jgi:glycosyltransferase involved in cell wall biosynthesis